MLKRLIAALLAIFATTASNQLAAQQQQQPLGLTIQLPTLTFFGVNTVVSVPDGGSISLGGNSGGAWGSTSRGVPLLANVPGANRLFNNRAIGFDQFASNMSVHVRIISLSEMEAELMSQLPPDRTLADYARPKPISLSMRQSGSPARASFRQSVPPSSYELVRSKSASAPESVSRDGQSAKLLSEIESSHHDAPTNQQAGSRSDSYGEKIVDPNGAADVQRKADFISRNIGRKKK